MDYGRLKHRLVRKPYPLPRMGDTMQKTGRIPVCDRIRSQHEIL